MAPIIDTVISSEVHFIRGLFWNIVIFGTRMIYIGGIKLICKVTKYLIINMFNR